MADNLICPTDGVPINETKVRVVAGLVLLIAITYALTNWLVLSLLLVVDFGLRSFDKGRYSPLANLADGVVRLSKLPYKGTDQAPKRFAARIGLGFVVTITIFHLAGITTGMLIVVLSIFAALESIIGFCAGCYVYTYFIRLFPKAA